MSSFLSQESLENLSFIFSELLQISATCSCSLLNKLRQKDSVVFKKSCIAADLFIQTSILGGLADKEATDETVIASFETEFPEEIT